MHNIQQSAIEDRDAFLPQVAEADSLALEEGEEGRVVRTWRDARYEEILHLKPSESRKRRKRVRIKESLETLSSSLRHAMLSTESGFFSSSSGDRESSSGSSVDVSAVPDSLKQGSGTEMKVLRTEDADMNLARNSGELGSSAEHVGRGTGGNWDWLVEYDELSMMMRQGLVLCGFIEAPITFPPSFKWKCKAHAGDFTDMAVLKGEFLGA